MSSTAGTFPAQSNLQVLTEELPFSIWEHASSEGTGQELEEGPTQGLSAEDVLLVFLDKLRAENDSGGIKGGVPFTSVSSIDCP